MFPFLLLPFLRKNETQIEIRSKTKKSINKTKDVSPILIAYLDCIQKQQTLVDIIYWKKIINPRISVQSRFPEMTEIRRKNCVLLGTVYLPLGIYIRDIYCAVHFMDIFAFYFVYAVCVWQFWFSCFWSSGVKWHLALFWMRYTNRWGKTTCTDIWRNSHRQWTSTKHHKICILI